MKKLAFIFAFGFVSNSFTQTYDYDPFADVSNKSIKFIESLDSSDYAKISNDILVKLNAHRKANGLKPVTSNVDMVCYANLHTKQMINDSTYNHSNLNNGLYRAENIMLTHLFGSFLYVDDAYMSNVDDMMMKSWKRSPGHNVNMLLSDVTQVGIAVYSKATVKNGKYSYIVEATMVLK
jgi:uncharacterized protein YkwD